MSCVQGGLFSANPFKNKQLMFSFKKHQETMGLSLAIGWSDPGVSQEYPYVLLQGERRSYQESYNTL